MRALRYDPANLPTFSPVLDLDPGGNEESILMACTERFLLLAYRGRFEPHDRDLRIERLPFDGSSRTEWWLEPESVDGSIELFRRERPEVLSSLAGDALVVALPNTTQRGLLLVWIVRETGEPEKLVLSLPPGSSDSWRARLPSSTAEALSKLHFAFTDYASGDTFLSTWEFATR